MNLFSEAKNYCNKAVKTELEDESLKLWVVCSLQYENEPARNIK